MTDKKALKTHFNPHLSVYILIYSFQRGPDPFTNQCVLKKS